MSTLMCLCGGGEDKQPALNCNSSFQIPGAEITKLFIHKCSLPFGRARSLIICPTLGLADMFSCKQFPGARSFYEYGLRIKPLYTLRSWTQYLKLQYAIIKKLNGLTLWITNWSQRFIVKVASGCLYNSATIPGLRCRPQAILNNSMRLKKKRPL